MRLVFLDSDPLGLLTDPRRRSKPDRCRQWVKVLAASEVRVFVPEIADDEVRRKLIHIRATAGVHQVGKFVVFNIGGNKYRLIAQIYYKNSVILIRHVMTHKEYDTGGWKSDLG